MTDKFFIKGLKNPYIITIIIILDYVQTCAEMCNNIIWVKTRPPMNIIV